MRIDFDPLGWPDPLPDEGNCACASRSPTPLMLAAILAASSAKYDSGAG